jgi:predicted nucleic acid-binding protein
MKNKAYDVTSYNFSKDEPLLLDANVWLYLFPAPSDTRTAPSGYSTALKQMLTVGAYLALDSIVISEYLTVYCRLEFRGALRKKYDNNLKDFRKSPDFSPVGASASLLAQKILKLCSRRDYPFANINIGQVLIDFESGAQDMNDLLLIESCRLNGWKFVTNDADCTEGGIEILTTNPKLIAACP